MDMQREVILDETIPGARGDVLDGIRITDPDAFLDVLAEGGSGYHFFGRSAEKVVLVSQQSQAMPTAPDYALSGA